MPTPSRADRLSRAYRETIARLRAEVQRRVAAEYDSIDMTDVNASFEAFAQKIEPTVITGQAAVARLAAAFVRAYGLATTGSRIEIDTQANDIVGTTKAGEPLAAGMAAWGPMVLARIGNGASIDEARDFGRFLVDRFTDNEVTGAADRELARQGDAVSRLTGWEGTVSPDACDPCQGNAGPHELGWEPYRHGSCSCVIAPIFAA